MNYKIEREVATFQTNAKKKAAGGSNCGVGSGGFQKSGTSPDADADSTPTTPVSKKGKK